MFGISDPCSLGQNLPPAQTLAFELLHDMFLRLSTTDLKTCTMVCQAWCAYSSYILFRTCDVQRAFWSDPRHVTSINSPAAKKYPEPDPADFKRFASAVTNPSTSHRFTTTIHTLRLHGLLDIALFQGVVHELKCLCDLHLDEVVFSPISTRRHRVSLLAIQRSSSTTPVSKEKRILKRLTVHEPNLNQLGPPFRYALWSISLLCFSRIQELNLSCSLRVPDGYTSETADELKKYATTKVSVHTLILRGIVSAFVDTAEVLQHVVDFEQLTALKIGSFLPLIDAEPLSRFFAAHGRSLIELDLGYRRSNFGLDPSRFVPRGRTFVYSFQVYDNDQLILKLLRLLQNMMREIRYASYRKHSRRFAPLSPKSGCHSWLPSPSR